ncbi:sensor histidine kinase [Paenibacillus piri]|nr:sensor histidine kinase [Paenibacillus piri]
MLKRLLRFCSGFYRTLKRKIFVKLILLIVIPNLLLLLIINQLMNKQIQQKIDEMDNTLYVLEHATSRELRALFNDVTTLTNQILIEPEVQRILSGSLKDAGLAQKEREGAAYGYTLHEDYANQEIMRSILSRQRLVWNNIFSIAIIDSNHAIYLNTSENYQLNASDLTKSLLLREIASPEQSGLAWSVNDAVTKNADMITIGRKIYGTNQPKRVIGYVLVNLSLNAVRDSFHTYNYFGQMIFGLVNKTETTWMIYDDHKMIGGHGPLLPRPLASVSSGLTEINLNGREWRTVIRQNEEQEFLFVGLDAEYIKSQAAVFRNNLYYGYAFFLLLAFLISLQGTKMLSQRLGALNRAMRTFGQKQWGTRIELKGTDEISIIGDTFNSMAIHIEGLLDDLREQQRLKRLFELRVLEYQINPHFLYNTLDSINWLALENNQTRISQMVNGLSKLFRLILSKGKEFITLQEEFEMIRIYLNIQKIRFEDRFAFIVDLDDDVAGYPIGKLMLQPLVENSIVHGIRRVRRQGILQVTGRRSEGKVILEISDNGVGMTPEQVQKQLELMETGVLEKGAISSGGYGMKNVDSRLKMIYGGHYRMTLVSSRSAPSGTTVRIQITESAMLGMKEE